MSGDGQPWVLAKEYNTKQMFTGIWSNNLGYNQNNLPGPSDGPIADLPAVLTAAEQTNRLDHKQGWLDTYLDWLPLAYTRRNGYDYVLIKPQTASGYVDPIYYDGRRQRWLPAYGYHNIYAFENGDVVLASLLLVKYINADGTTRWTWECPQNGPGDPGAGASETPFISGNGECVQIKNVSLVGFVAPPPYQPLDNVQSASTAQLDNREWTPHAEGFREGAVTLSRTGAPPICVVHRSLDRNTYDYDASEYKTFRNYQTNFYATNETLDVVFDGNWGRPQSHRVFYGRQVGGMSFDCAPSCLCSCAIPSSIAY
ncbi:MAG: hypothetical protein IT281_10180 [Ignavibacteria bacterium]|nr:hypothetical protein [Ignavibacteria bacterium]